MKKKIIAAALAVCMMTTLAIGMTLAYFTDSKTTNNTFTVGNVKIELTEPNWVNSGFIDGKTVYAGEPLKKDPTVENTGANPCFVRIKVDGLDTLVPTPLPEGQLKDNWMIKFRTGTSNSGLGQLGTDWADGGDGYYYYTKILEANRPENSQSENPMPTKTPALFDYIVMPTALTNGTGLAKHVTVTAQAIQAQGARASWSAVKTMNVADIAEWFSDNMPAATP